MKAQIFHLKKSQDDLVSALKVLLAQHIYRGIDLEPLGIGADYNEHSDQIEHEYCNRFLSLFKASLIPADDLAILVEDGAGKSWYMGAYRPSNDRHFLRLFNSGMHKVFPAIAIMGRMVMMPREVGDAFDTSREFRWFVKPRDLEGVVLVDFQDPSSVEDGVRQVGEQIMLDIRKLCRRHMLFRNVKRPDFDELGTLLHVSRIYLEENRDRITAPGAEFVCEIVSGSAKRGADSEVVLKVSYHGEKSLGYVGLSVNAPFEVIRDPVKQALEFRRGKTETQVRFKVTPKTPPYCPLEAQFTMDETDAIAAGSVPLILDVQP
jgi:hypothetical protein